MNRILLLTIILLLNIFFSFPLHAATYTYDSLSRLKEADYGSIRAVYRYDAGGNLTDIRYIRNGDADGDGLPDTWEQQIINADLNDAISTTEDVTPWSDFDGDGRDNLAEYQHSTDPINPLSPKVGDLNRDGFTDLADAIISLKISANVQDNTDILKTASINEHYRIGIGDAIYILQTVAKMRD